MSCIRHFIEKRGHGFTKSKQLVSLRHDATKNPKLLERYLEKQVIDFYFKKSLQETPTKEIELKYIIKK